MDKNKKRKAYDKVYSLTVELTAGVFQVSQQYVRQALNGTSTTGRTDDIKKYFNKKYQELKHAAAPDKTNV